MAPAPGDTGPAPPRLSGAGVVLRALSEADLPRQVETVTDPATVWGTSMPTPFAGRDAVRYLAGVRRGWAENTRWTLAIARATDPDTYVGEVVLVASGTGRAEIGYLTHPDARGAGLTTAAVRTVLRWGLGPMGLTSVEWRSRADHVASRRVAENCGIRVEGLLREGMEQRGVRLDCLVGSVLAGEPLEPLGPPR